MIILVLLVVIDLFLLGYHLTLIHPPAELGMTPAALARRTTKAIYSATALIAVTAFIAWYASKVVEGLK